MGYDLSLTQAPIEPIRKVMAACRAAGYPVMHTREGHRPDLSDLPANKVWRSEQIGARIGSLGPMGRILIRGEPGWELIPELAPEPGEVVIDKPGKGSFCATDLDLILKTGGIRNIVLAGITTDVCVSTTMREANDMGYECLLLTDCTAATEPANRDAIFSMVQKQGGVFGAIASSNDFIAAITQPATPIPMAEKALNGTAGPMATITNAVPYPYSFPLDRTALIMIDFQRDFIYPGGFGAALGNDVNLLLACLPAASRLLTAARAAGLKIVHTLEAHKPDLSDLPHSKWTRGNPAEGMRIGDKASMGRILIANEPGNGIVDEVVPLENEKLVHKPGKGAFYATDLQEYLTSNQITHLLFAGVTTEVCVQTSMREANDRGYECLVVSDATESYIPEFKTSTLAMVTAQGGIVGWVADSEQVVAAMEAAVAK
jgi:biuret amidohydrolase